MLLLYMLPCQSKMFPSTTNNRGIYENDTGLALTRNIERTHVPLKAVSFQILKIFAASLIQMVDKIVLLDFTRIK